MICDICIKVGSDGTKITEKEKEDAMMAAKLKYLRFFILIRIFLSNFCELADCH